MVEQVQIFAEVVQDLLSCCRIFFRMYYTSDSLLAPALHIILLCVVLPGANFLHDGSDLEFDLVLSGLKA